MAVVSESPDAERVANTLLKMWATSLETPEGREIVTSALCRAMRGVAGSGCSTFCPKADAEAASRALMTELMATLGDAAQHVSRLTATVERAEYLAEKI